MMSPADDQSSGAGARRVISIPDPVVCGDLVAHLQLPAQTVIAALMEHNYLASLTAEIDFTAASAVCSRYGVVARKII
jgi:hypothetical protein